MPARHLLQVIYTILAETAESFDALEESLMAKAPAEPDAQDNRRLRILALGGDFT